MRRSARPGLPNRSATRSVLGIPKAQALYGTVPGQLKSPKYLMRVHRAQPKIAEAVAYSGAR